MALSQRKELILAAVVEFYIATGEPVGSKFLVTALPFTVSSATIRNEMAELSELGYLEQPHTSAGRIPSDQGLRYYVDRLLDTVNPSESEMFRILSTVDHTEGDAKRILSQLCDLTAQLTGMAAVATTPFSDRAVINNVQVLPVGKKAALVLVSTTAGVLKSRIAKLSAAADYPLLELFYNVAAANFIGAPCESVNKAMLQQITVNLGERALDIAPLLVSLFDAVAQSAEADVIVRGRRNLLDSALRADAPAIIEFTSEPERLLPLLKKNRDGGLHFSIGKENGSRSLQNASVVTAGYSAGNGTAGVIGVLGPTKMDYARVIPLLRYVGDVAGRLIADNADDTTKE